MPVEIKILALGALLLLRVGAGNGYDWTRK